MVPEVQMLISNVSFLAWSVFIWVGAPRPTVTLFCLSCVGAFRPTYGVVVDLLEPLAQQVPGMSSHVYSAVQLFGFSFGFISVGRCAADSVFVFLAAVVCNLSPVGWCESCHNPFGSSRRCRVLLCVLWMRCGESDAMLKPRCVV